MLEGGDLLLTWERGRGQDPLRRAVTLYAAVAGRSAQEAAAVDVGSRDARLAAALAGTVGATVWTVLDCTACAERLDVPVDVGAVARAPSHAAGAVFPAAGGGVTVDFRLPTTADLAALPTGEPAAARRVLLDRCVLTPGDVPEDVAQAVEAAMDAVSPASAVDVVVRCGGCQEATTAVLDVPALLWAEVEVAARSLVVDVHALARAYGWSEAEVLGLSAARRAAYLALVRS